MAPRPSSRTAQTPSVGPTAQVPPLPMAGQPPARGVPRYVVIALVAIILGGGAIGIYFAMQ